MVNIVNTKSSELFAIFRKSDSVLKIILMSVNMPLAPIFSRLYVERK